VRPVLAALTRASGADVPLAYAPRRAGDPTAVFADNARAKAILGWTPQYDLDEIVSSAWRWHQRHPSGYA
jgi:UDP-glucose 4-epimerase